MQLTKENFNFEYSGDQQHIKWELANNPRYTNPWSVREGNEIRDEIIQALRIKGMLEYYREFPSAFNYAQFEDWINKIFEDSKI